MSEEHAGWAPLLGELERRRQRGFGRQRIPVRLGR